MLIRRQRLSGNMQNFHNKTLYTLTTVQKTAYFIFAASVIYLLVVLIIAPYKILRYGMPVFPFFVILPVLLINSFKEKTSKIAVCAMLLLCVCFAFNATKESNIENIFRNKPAQYVFTKDKETPVYVINADWSSWKYGNLVPYLNDEQTYYFIDWFKNFKGYFNSGEEIESIILPDVENYGEIYLLTEYFPDFFKIDDLIMENMQTEQGAALKYVKESDFEIYTGETESWFPYFIGKKLILDGR
jgi:hypothetical protein